MTKRASFSQAEITRAVKGARAVDPLAVVEVVTERGTIRILPATAPIQAKADPLNEWRARRDDRLKRGA